MSLIEIRLRRRCALDFKDPRHGLEMYTNDHTGGDAIVSDIIDVDPFTASSVPAV